jgi:hypothetical protein
MNREKFLKVVSDLRVAQKSLMDMAMDIAKSSNEIEQNQHRIIEAGRLQLHRAIRELEALPSTAIKVDNSRNA